MQDRPIDRLFTWGDGGWGMVFGEPENVFFGRPMVMVGPPDNWGEIVSLKPLTKGDDDAIFDEVRAARRGK